MTARRRSGCFDEFVADDDELQVGIHGLLLQFGLERGERLDDADDVLVRADASGVKQERIGHLVAFGDELTIGVGGVSQAEAIVERVVDDFDLFARHVKEALCVFLGEIGDRKDTRRPMQHALGELEVQRTASPKMRC